MKENKGITLIALIITVIVLLILAGTAISIAINGGDIFSKASEAREEWNIAIENEGTNLNEALNILNTITIDNTSQETVISKDTTYNSGNGFVGYYADINGDGTIDGIIYVDLLVQAGTSEQWASNYGAYVIPSTVNANNVKDYVISQTAQIDTRFDSRERDVVKIADTQTNSNPLDRFYVMGLDDLTNGTTSTFYWYRKAYYNMDDYATATSRDFGTGRANTASIKAKWDLGSEEGGYGERDIQDLWGYLPNSPKAGANLTASANDTETYRWFIPSNGEWGAFANAFNISKTSTDTTYFANFGLNASYWASSQVHKDRSWNADFLSGSMWANFVNNHDAYVRVSATF